MIYLSGAVSPALLARPRASVGFMLQPGMGNTPAQFPGRPFAADNGCFAKGDSFDVAGWLAWLERLRSYQADCLFAVAPDVYGDPVATLERSLPHLAAIRALGYRAAFVAQNGAERNPLPWHAFDCLFIGGSDAWKLTEPAHDLVAEAKRRGKWAHLGRANSYRRLKAAAYSGCDSADGTFVKYAPDENVQRMYVWLDKLQRQPLLMTGTAVCLS